MSTHKRIQALERFIANAEQYKTIPEIKTQIETLHTALRTLKAFSNDKQILKTTLHVMKQTNELIKKYGVQLNTEPTEHELKRQRTKEQRSLRTKFELGLLDDIEIIEEKKKEKEQPQTNLPEPTLPDNTIVQEEEHNERENAQIEENEECADVQMNDEERDGGIGGGCEVGGVIERNAKEGGGGGVSGTPNIAQYNFPLTTSSKNIQKKFSTSDLQSLPTNVITDLNLILTAFRKARDV